VVGIALAAPAPAIRATARAKAPNVLYLKTPIRHLKQRLETSRRTSKTVEDYRNVLDNASDEIDSIVETFEALLRIAQIEAGARKARFSEIVLNDVLANVAEAYEQVGEDSGFKFTTNLSQAKSITIYGDRELLTQLFANLLENSFHHCLPGTEVNIKLLSNSHGPVVQITDTGPGIPAEERENVFRRLYRLEKARTTPGNGLGLSLVAAIADLHEAMIELSENKPGLCVSVQFPKGGIQSDQESDDGSEDRF
jgi:signal transduction histidine kinase